MTDNWRRYETWRDSYKSGGENPHLYRPDSSREAMDPANPLRFRVGKDTETIERLGRDLDFYEPRLKLYPEGHPEHVRAHDYATMAKEALDDIRAIELEPRGGFGPHDPSKDFVIPPEATSIRNSNNPYWWKTEDGRKYIDALRKQREPVDNVYPMEPPRRSSGGNVGGNDSLSRALDLARSIAQQYPTQ